jgi:AraC-like DNA-binding protein
MKHLLFFAIILAAVTPVTAQQQKNVQVDSITALLPQLRDTAKLNAMLTLTELTDGEPTRKRYVDMLLNEAQLQKNPRYEGRALTLLIEWYGSQFLDSTFVVGEEAIRFTREHKLHDLLFLAHHMHITNYVNKGLLLTAIRKAEDVYAEAKALQDNLPMARMLAALGLIYNEMGLYEEAVRYYEESMKVATQERLPNIYLYIQNYDHLAILSGVLKRFDEVLRYADSLHVELDRFRENAPTANLQTFYLMEAYHRATAYANLKRTNQSLEAIRWAEALFEPQWRGTWFEIVIDEMYIDYYFATGNHDKALEHIRRASQFYEENQLESNLLEKQRFEARALFEKGSYKAAAEVYRSVIDRTELLNQKQFYGQINELRTLYELDKAEMEAERRLGAIRRQRMMITGLTFACLGLLLIVGLVVWNRREIMKKNRALYRQIKEQDRLAAEVQNVTPQQTDDTRQRQLFDRLHDYLLCDQNLAKQDIDIADLVTCLTTNRTSLFAAVKAITGKTLQEYINVVKLNEARQLLETSPEPLDDIIETCGFASKSTFYRLFREHYNIPPAEYRQIAKKSRG